jgi:Na+/proline symporter
MTPADYLIILLYFAGLLAVGWLLGKRISSSREMFIAGKNSSWWLSGLSTYMTFFSASTFAVWGGVTFKHGLCATAIGMMVGVVSIAVGLWVSGKWARMNISSPAEYLTHRFGDKTLKFYSVVLIIGRAVHTAVALYAISIMVVAVMPLPEGHVLADPATGHLRVQWAVVILGLITFVYTAMGGYLAVLMTDVVQFAVLFVMFVVLVPLSLHYAGGFDAFAAKAPEGFFRITNSEYPGAWLVLWTILNFFMIGGDWPFVQRYISVPTAKDARKSSYLVGALYLLTPILWYLPVMVYRTVDPGANPEQAYMLMSQRVLGPGLLGFMIAAMMSATLSLVSGTLNVFANVFTCDLYLPRHPEATEAQKIRVGRLFTYIYGIMLVVIALLLPLLGGAEKVVVMLLTVVISPIFIPSIWGLFSKKIRGRDVITSMGVTYVLAILVKFHLLFPEWVSANSYLADAIVGCLVPLFMLTVFEIAGRKRPVEEGYLKMESLLGDENRMEDAVAKKAGRAYSGMALKILAGTYLAVGLISLVLSFFFPATRRLLLLFGGALTAISLLAFLVLRIVNARRSAP